MPTPEDTRAICKNCVRRWQCHGPHGVGVELTCDEARCKPGSLFLSRFADCWSERVWSHACPLLATRMRKEIP